MTERKWLSVNTLIQDQDPRNERPNTKTKTQGTKDPTKTQGTKDPTKTQGTKDPTKTHYQHKTKGLLFVIVVVCRNRTIEHILTHVLTHIFTNVFVHHFMYRRRQRNATFEVTSNTKTSSISRRLYGVLICVDLSWLLNPIVNVVLCAMF